tara:strand:- start:143 stop:463 length:321 start_codon:yes stop_codon:yes gene_type:complete
MPRKKPKKRKPQKRKRVIETLQVNDIPYSKYRIEWIDCVSDSGWATDKEFDKMKLATPVNEGWVYERNKKHIKLFASYDKEDDGSITFGDRTMIPTSWITKITKLN